MALATLAAALVWNAPTFALEADAEAAATRSGEPVYHTLEPGETLSAIAVRYGTSVASLIRANGITDARKIQAGVRLRIPSIAEPDRPLGAAQTRAAAGTEVAEIAALIDRCEAELRAARFEQALASAAAARDRIDARKVAGDGPNRARLEVASATAYVALGQNDAALESLERALVADPDLELDPALTSPKVLAVFRVARGRAPAPPRAP